MSNQLTRVIYKPSTQSSEEYIIMIDAAEYKKWKEGDTSIPLSQIVGTFQVYHSVQGNQGKLGQASQQQLENEFGTSRDDDVIKIILEKGTMQGGYDFADRTMDKMRYGQQLDTRGKSTSGV